MRRWIRSGKLRSQRIGTQYLVEEGDVDALADGDWAELLPKAWRRTSSGDPMPNWARILRDDRGSH